MCSFSAVPSRLAVARWSGIRPGGPSRRESYDPRRGRLARRRERSMRVARASRIRRQPAVNRRCANRHPMSPPRNLRCHQNRGPHQLLRSRLRHRQRRHRPHPRSRLGSRCGSNRCRDQVPRRPRRWLRSHLAQHPRQPRRRPRLVPSRRHPLWYLRRPHVQCCRHRRRHHRARHQR